jgi:hypothetical protein
MYVPTFLKQLAVALAGVTAQRQRQDGDALPAPRWPALPGDVPRRSSRALRVDALPHAPPVRAALLGTSLYQDCIAGKTIQRDWDIAADGHESSCLEECTKSCNQSGLIYPSKAGLILPSAAGTASMQLNEPPILESCPWPQTPQREMTASSFAQPGRKSACLQAQRLMSAWMSPDSSCGRFCRPLGKSSSEPSASFYPNAIQREC